MSLSDLDKDIVTARAVARREREEAEQRQRQQQLAEQDARRRLSEARDDDPGTRCLLPDVLGARVRM